MNKLDYKKTFFLGFGIFAVTVCTSVYAAFVPVFLNRYLNKAWLIGFLLTFDSYIGLFLQPAVGRLSDRTRTRLGRRIPFILVGMPLAAVFICLIPAVAGLPALVAALVLYNLALSLYRLPTTSLMPDITPEPFRSKANGVINLMGGMGAALALGGGPILYKIDAAFPFYAAGAVLLISMGVIVWKIREHRDSLVFPGDPVAGRAPPAGQPTPPPPPRKLACARPSPPTKKSVPLLMAGVFFIYVAYNAVFAFFTLYGAKHLNADMGVSARTMVFFAVFVVAAALPAGILGSKLGKKKTIVLGLCLLTVVFAGMIFIRRLESARLLLVAGGIAWALVIINLYPFVVSMTDTLRAGSFTGLYYLFTALAAIVSPPLAGTMIDRLGYGILFPYVTAAFLLALGFVLLIRPPRAAPRE